MSSALNTERINSKTSRQVLHKVIDNKVYIAQNIDVHPDHQCRCFHTREIVAYHALCDDFGPMNMASVIRFIQALQAEIAAFPNKKIVYCVEEGRRALTNAVFLLGAYMIIKMNLNAEQVSKSFGWVDRSVIEPFRDATFEKPDFELTLKDCWRGLERGRNLGWVRLPQHESDDSLWGKIEVDEYEHYDDPLNADMHEVVPGKFVAFKGPKDLSGRDFHDNARGYRSFSPHYYVDIFQMLGVKAVIRLNEPEYDAHMFEAHGIRHHDLEFEDCSSPPPHIVDAFFQAVDGTRGAVAVHCKAGLGRTGTLIALYLMRSHGFGAREAMGWLRIMRPGSIIGEQQHYLCEVESSRHGTSASTPAPDNTSTPAARSGACIKNHPSIPPSLPLASGCAGAPCAVSPSASRCCGALAAQVAKGMERRAVARVNERAMVAGVGARSQNER